MSFTEDELQAFNSILEQRFAAHRQEIEQAIDQRLGGVQQAIDSHYTQLRQEVLAFLAQRFAGETAQGESVLPEQLDEQRDQLARLFKQEGEQQSRQIEATVDRMLAAQLLGIEQLLSQHATRRQAEGETSDVQQQVETIEVQTELSWDDLVAVMSRALDERLVSLGDALQLSVKNLEHYLTARFHSLRDDLARFQGSKPAYSGVNTFGNGTSVQDVLAGIEHLERVMESMQVAMTANHALLSNRLYHHQQLPLERAHPSQNGQTRVSPASTAGSLLTQARERLAGGSTAEPDDEGDEPTGH